MASRRCGCTHARALTCGFTDGAPAYLFLSAVQAGHLDAVRLLLQHGADTNAVDQRQSGLLHVCALRNRQDVLRFLLEEGGMSAATAATAPMSDTGDTALHVAIRENNFEIAHYLIEHGGAGAVEARNAGGYTPLLLAAVEGNVDFMRFLVEHAHADARATTADGSTLVHLAVQHSHLPVLRYVVEDLGLAMTDKDMQGWPPLFHAANLGKLEVRMEHSRAAAQRMFTRASLCRVDRKRASSWTTRWTPA